MIIVDSSVWIDYFNGTENTETDRLDTLLGVEPLAVGDYIVLEVLQDFRSDDHFDQAKKLLDSLTTLTPRPRPRPGRGPKLPGAPQDGHHGPEVHRHRHSHILHRTESPLALRRPGLHAVRRAPRSEVSNGQVPLAGSSEVVVPGSESDRGAVHTRVWPHTCLVIATLTG